jgi:predicted transcriptional regulator
MNELTALEKAVLQKIASQCSEACELLYAQLTNLSVTDRRNTGAGFYTAFKVDSRCQIVSVNSPIGEVTAEVSGLDHGMGFLLWLKNGYINQLEGYSFEEDTSDIDWTNLNFEVKGLTYN